MTHFYERNIVDIKNEYTTYLTDILVPLIYEGIQSIYNHALETRNKLEMTSKSNSSKSPNVMKIFQTSLKGVPTLSASAIETEAKRIKEFSRCSEWFDDLVKAVIKSYIILLTYNASGKTCKLVGEKHHEKINVNEFIHKCYIECSIIFFNHPELFWTEHNKETMQTCKNIAYKLIRQSITDAIHKMLPIKLILQEYLNNDYIPKTQEEIAMEKHQHSKHDEDSQLNRKFNPPPPENGFSLLESSKSEHEVNDVNLLMDSSEIGMNEHDTRVESEIKERLGQIMGEDDTKREYVGNGDVPQQSNLTKAIQEQKEKTPEQLQQPPQIIQMPVPSPIPLHTELANKGEKEPLRYASDNGNVIGEDYKMIHEHMPPHVNTTMGVLPEHDVDRFFTQFLGE